MTFIVILLALIIERFFDWSHLRQWSWYTRYQAMMTKRFSNHSSIALMFAATLIPILIVVALVTPLLSGLMFGLFGVVFQLLILLYCLGPQNLWADVFVAIGVFKQPDANLASESLKNTFGVIDANSPESMHRAFLNKIFIEANTRVFAVIFWYFILGPLGAVLYRLVAVAATTHSQEPNPALTQMARTIEAILDWAPIRALTFIFALGGHFTQVFNFWRKKAGQGLSSNDVLITECGAAALGAEDSGVLALDGTAEKNAIGLLDRAFVITLVFVAILTLWF